MAIDGLQRRLLRTMGVKGKFGILESDETDGLLRRSLLWVRGTDTATLDKIDFTTGGGIRAVPSWSWMAYIDEESKEKTGAYTGGIDYLKLDFDGVDWEEVTSPWSSTAEGLAQRKVQKENIAMMAKLCEYTYQPLPKETTSSPLTFDNPGKFGQCGKLCVVLGIQKDPKPPEKPIPIDQKLHYLLLVTPSTTKDVDGNMLYERVGAGHLPGGYIKSSQEMVKIQ